MKFSQRVAKCEQAYSSFYRSCLITKWKMPADEKCEEM
jgi:hypothetical protein